MSQSQLRKNVSKTLASVALGGLLAGTAGLVSGCSHDDNAGTKASNTAGVQHACKGQNACKGQGGCKTSEHACKGQNACKGKGGCKA